MKNNIKTIISVLIFCLCGCISIAAGKSEQQNKDTDIKEKPGLARISFDKISSESPGEGEFILTGTVQIYISAEGTFSEVKYFTLLTEENLEYYLFDESGKSFGFDEYAGKKCTVTGTWEEGKIGFKGDRAEGIIVISIDILE